MGRGGIEEREVVTECTQSLYIAQCATGVEAHLSSILKLLPARNKSSEQEKMAEREQEERTSKLLSAASLGHGLWIEWIVANACTKFGLALQEVCGGGSDSVGAGEAVLQAPRSKIPGLPLLRDLKRMWEEVEISVETEGGESKTEKVRVFNPSSSSLSCCRWRSLPPSSLTHSLSSWT